MTHRKLYVLAWMLGSLSLLPFDRVAADGAREALVVIVGQAFPGDTISFAALKSAFRGQRIEVGGKAVIPINHPLETPTRVAFDRIALGLEPAAVGRFWVDLRIRDQGRPPTAASTPELALRIAAALAGAITYASQSASITKWPLKVLKVDAKTAGQPGYPLNGDL
jgi:hypothetical protein